MNKIHEENCRIIKEYAQGIGKNITLETAKWLYVILYDRLTSGTVFEKPTAGQQLEMAQAFVSGFESRN